MFFSPWASPFLLCFLAANSSSFSVSSFPGQGLPHTSADIDDEPSMMEAILSSLSVVSSPSETAGSWQLFDGVAELSDGSWLTEAEV